MTDTPTPIAGWYPDPAGRGRIQWWDGSQWTEHFAEPAAQPSQQPSAPASPAYGEASPGYAPAAYTPQPYAPGAPYSAMPEKLVAPAGTKPYNLFVWLLALLPLVNLVSGIVSSFSLDEQIENSMSATPSDVFTPEYFLSLGLSFLLIALAVLFALLDYRALVRAGVPRPFHWAWSFLIILNAPVYIIGRSIVVRRRTGSGLIPMFVYLALWVATFVIGIVIAAAALGPIFDELSQTGY